MDEMEIEGMEKKAKIPKLRFPGFTGAWEERQAGEIFISIVDKGHPELPVLSASQERGMVFRNDIEKNILHNEENESTYKKVIPGQFVIHLRSFQGGFAHSDIEGITSPAYTVIGFIDSNRNNDKYWKYVFSSENFINILVKITYGIRDGRSISYADFKILKFFMPCYNEQKAIGEFLCRIDNLIDLYKRKLAHLQAKKKCLLQKMFPKKGERFPELRFPGFTDAWEQKKLGDIGTVAMCKRIFKEQTVDKGEIPFYKIGTFGGEADAYISRELFENFKQEYSYPEVGDVLISASGSVGRTVVYKGEDAYFQDSNIVWLKHDGCVDNSFLGQFYSMIPWQGLEGSTIKRLYNKNILETEIYLPVEKEQKKIGLFLGRFDKLIALHERKLIYLQIQKKALLQQMFV